MKIKGIIFDLDGTLLNTLDDIANSFNHALQLHGLKQYPTQRYKDFIGSGVKVLAQKAVGVEDKNLIESVLADYKAYYADHSADTTKPFPHIPQVLRILSESYKLSVLSNKPHTDTVPLIEKYFPDIPFTCVYGQLDGVPRKPDPTAARMIAKEMHLLPQEIAYVGDSENDILVANNASMLAISVLWGFRTVEQIKDAGICYAFCEKAEDIISVLEELNHAKE